jgi:hypothetical protein
MERIWAATASAISPRPWPTLQYQRLAMASISSWPSAVQSRAPAPRTTSTNAGRAGAAKGWRNRGVVLVLITLDRTVR